MSENGWKSQIPVLIEKQNKSTGRLMGDTDLSWYTIDRLKRGKIDVTLQNFLKVCDALGVTPDEAIVRNN